jgi:hypothetical protein
LTPLQYGIHDWCRYGIHDWGFVFPASFCAPDPELTSAGISGFSSPRGLGDRFSFLIGLDTLPAVDETNVRTRPVIGQQIERGQAMFGVPNASGARDLDESERGELADCWRDLVSADPVGGKILIGAWELAVLFRLAAVSMQLDFQPSQEDRVRTR